GAEIFHTLKKRLKDAGHQTNVGDEGGFAPNLKSAQAGLDFVMASIEGAGFRPGGDVGLDVDWAATEMFKEGASVTEGEKTTRRDSAPAKMSGWRSIAPRPSAKRKAPTSTRARRRRATRRRKRSTSPSSPPTIRSSRSWTAWPRTTGRAGRR